MPYTLSRLKDALREPTILNSGTTVVRMSARSLWGLVIPAVLSIKMYGSYSLFLATSNIVSQLSLLGAPQTVTRESGNEQFAFLGVVLHALFLLGVVSVLISLFAPDLWGGMSLAVIGFSASNCGAVLFGAWRRSKLDFHSLLLAEASGALFMVGAVVFLGFRSSKGKAVDLFDVVPIDIMVPVVILCSLALQRSPGVSERMVVSGVSKFLPSVYSVGFLVLFDIAIWRRIEVFFLERSPDGLEGVAVFGVASQVASLLSAIPSAVTEAWFPFFARANREGRQALRTLIREKLFLYRRAYLVYPVFGALFTFLILQVLYQQYQPWLFAIVVVVFVRLVFGYFGIYSSILYATKHEISLYPVVIGGSVISIAANYLLTTPNGIDGVMLAYTITQSAVGLGTYIAYRIVQRRSDEPSSEIE